MSKKVNFISRIGKYLSIGTKLLLYKCLVGPHLQFCSTILYGLPMYKMNEFQRIQNRAMRTILKVNRYTPVKFMLDCLNLLSVKQKLYCDVMMFVFKLKNNLLPKYLCEKIVYVREAQPFNLRNADHFGLSM